MISDQMIRMKQLSDWMLSENKYKAVVPAATLAGAGLAMTLSNPFDLIRIRMQTMVQLVELGALQKTYKGVLDCAKRVRSEEGLKAFWKGNGANLLRFYASQSINFTTKESIRSWIASAHSKSSLAVNTLSGVLGSWLALSILYPIQHARNRLSNNIGSKKQTILGSILKTINKQGIFGLYRGSSISVVGVAIFRGAYFGIFDTYKNGKENFQRWMLAYVSSLTGIALTYPSDTIRRRLMCTSASLKYAGFTDCFCRIYSQEGLRSFYRGCPIIFLQSFSSACVLFLYDKISNDLKQFYF